MFLKTGENMDKCIIGENGLKERTNTFSCFEKVVGFSKKDKNKCPFFIFQNKLGEIVICDHKKILWSRAEKNPKHFESIIFYYFFGKGFRNIIF